MYVISNYPVFIRSVSETPLSMTSLGQSGSLQTDFELKLDHCSVASNVRLKFYIWVYNPNTQNN